jgi:calcium-dependent protein kinase
MRLLLHSVKCLHEAGIIHRDLKLDNIMINQTEVRIIDFGLSKVIQDKQKLTTLVGTPHYIAPEIFQNCYDEKCDVWSLGVIAYLLFSQGEFPFEGDSEIQVFKAIRKGKFYLPEEQRPSVTSDGPYDWATMSEEAKDFIT